MVVSPLASPHVRVLCVSSKSVSFVPRGHWATSGNIFDCPNRRGWAVTCYYRLCIEARDIAGTLPWPGQPHDQEAPLPHMWAAGSLLTWTVSS